MNAAKSLTNGVNHPQLNYHLFKASNSLFGLTFDELDDTQKQSAQATARRTLKLEHLILMSQEARETPVAKSEIQQAMDSIQEKYADAIEMQIDLERNGMAMEAFEDALGKELRVNAVLEKVKARAIVVDDFEIELFYHMHYERFKKPETRMVRHILVTINEDISDNCREVAAKRIQSIARRLERKSKRFDEQALKHSECPTALHGGLIGDVPRGKLFSELDAVLFKLGAGEISDVVESPIGFHILQCEMVHPPSMIPFDQVRSVIEQKIQEKQTAKCVKEWLASVARTPLAEV